LETAFSVVCAAAVVTHRHGKQLSAATAEQELCFLCDPCRGVISGTKFRDQLVENQSVKRRLGDLYEMAASLAVKSVEALREL
jgi:NADH:ubiquinone oxidoreductase subunit F (NADH-binding)